MDDMIDMMRKYRYGEFDEIHNEKEHWLGGGLLYCYWGYCIVLQYGYLDG